MGLGPALSFRSLGYFQASQVAAHLQVADHLELAGGPGDRRTGTRSFGTSHVLLLLLAAWILPKDEPAA